MKTQRKGWKFNSLLAKLTCTKRTNNKLGLILPNFAIHKSRISLKLARVDLQIVTTMQSIFYFLLLYTLKHKLYFVKRDLKLN